MRRGAALAAAFASTLFFPPALALPHPQGEQAAPQEYRVILRDHAPYYNPRRLNVPVGSRVVWENQGPGLIHTVLIHTQSGTERSGAIRVGQAWSHVFKEDAVVKSNCEVHPYMTGYVVVGSPSEELDTAVLPKEAPSDSGPQGGQIIEFPLSVPKALPGILEVDREDNVWFAMGGGGFGHFEYPPLNKIGKLTLDGRLTVYSLPAEGSGPSGLTIARDGTVFVTELFGNKIARFHPVKRILEEFSLPSREAWPTGLALDSLGNLWFNETYGNKLARLSPEGVIREFPVPTAGSRSTGMVIDQQDNVWVAERGANKIGCLRPDGSFIEYSIPTPRSKPTGMAVDSAGRVWFAEREGNKIGVIEDGRVKEFPLPQPGSGPFILQTDRDDKIWFTEMYGNRIGMLEPASGKVTEYDLPTPDSWPLGLDMDSQGNLWFTEQLGNKVGVMLRKPGQEIASGEGH